MTARPIVHWPESQRESGECENCGQLSRYIYRVKSQLPNETDPEMKSWKDWPTERMCDDCIASEAVVGHIKHVFV